MLKRRYSIEEEPKIKTNGPKQSRNRETRRHSLHCIQCLRQNASRKKDPFENLTAKQWIQISRENQTLQYLTIRREANQNSHKQQQLNAFHISQQIHVKEENVWRWNNLPLRGQRYRGKTSLKEDDLPPRELGISNRRPKGLASPEREGDVVVETETQGCFRLSPLSVLTKSTAKQKISPLSQTISNYLSTIRNQKVFQTPKKNNRTTQ